MSRSGGMLVCIDIQRLLNVVNLLFPLKVLLIG